MSAVRMLDELVNLRDALVCGEVVNGQAATRLTTLLAQLSSSVFDLPTAVPPTAATSVPARLMPTRCVWCFGIDCTSVRCQTNHRSVTWIDCPNCGGNSDGFYDPHCRHCYGYGWIEQSNAVEPTPTPGAPVYVHTITVPVEDGMLMVASGSDGR